MSGRFVFEVGDRSFVARKGDVVMIPGGSARSYANVTGTGAHQLVTMVPGIDVAAFFCDLAEATDPGEGFDANERAKRLQHFEQRWAIDFLGPAPTHMVLGIEP